MATLVVLDIGDCVPTLTQVRNWMQVLPATSDDVAAHMLLVDTHYTTRAESVIVDPQCQTYIEFEASPYAVYAAAAAYLEDWPEYDIVIFGDGGTFVRPELNGVQRYLSEQLASHVLCGPAGRERYDRLFPQLQQFLTVGDYGTSFTGRGATLSESCFAAQADFIRELHAHDILIPPVEWSIPYGTYLHWTAALRGRTVSLCGSVVLPEPPWFCLDMGLRQS
jgi:hypothetical protein